MGLFSRRGFLGGLLGGLFSKAAVQSAASTPGPATSFRSPSSFAYSYTADPLSRIMTYTYDAVGSCITPVSHITSLVYERDQPRFAAAPPPEGLDVAGSQPSSDTNKDPSAAPNGHACQLESTPALARRRWDICGA